MSQSLADLKLMVKTGANDPLLESSFIEIYYISLGQAWRINLSYSAPSESNSWLNVATWPADVFCVYFNLTTAHSPVVA